MWPSRKIEEDQALTDAAATDEELADSPSDGRLGRPRRRTGRRIKVATTLPGGAPPPTTAATED